MYIKEKICNLSIMALFFAAWFSVLVLVTNLSLSKHTDTIFFHMLYSRIKGFSDAYDMILGDVRSVPKKKDDRI
jgi:predicted secreted protein